MVFWVTPKRNNDTILVKWISMEIKATLEDSAAEELILTISSECSLAVVEWEVWVAWADSEVWAVWEAVDLRNSPSDSVESEIY